MIRSFTDFPPAAELGTATIENRTPFRRRVMQVVTLPLKDSDGFRLGDPVTVADPGTGQDERCQVESWAMPYPSGHERVIRLTYPAVLQPNTLRTTHAFSRSSAGVLPPLALRPNVLQAFSQLQFAFFCGPKATHYVAWAAVDNPVPVYVGTRSMLLRWFRRVYEPVQAPALRTQFWCEVDLELFHDEDYGTVHVRFGVCDPRISTDGEDRSALSVSDSEIGLYITAGSSQHWCQPVPLYQDHSVRSLAWEAAQSRWKWVIDKRTIGTFGGPVNDFLPWGCMAHVKAAFVFRGGTGTLGDALRDDSMRAWYAGGELTFTHAVADTWMANQEAYGPNGAMSPRPKRHQHWERTRDAEYVRAQIENTHAIGHYQAKSAVAGGNLWTSFDAKQSQVYGNVQGDGTGNHASWGSQTGHYAAMAYSVPGVGHYLERGFLACPWFYFYREIDGSIVSAFDHPNMIIDKGQPGQSPPGFGDLLGKSGLGRWRGAGAANYTIRSERTGDAYTGADEAHFEVAGVCIHPAVFGDRGVRRVAEHLCYTIHLGDWQPLPQFLGATGQARGFARGCVMASWFLWLFGDARLAQRYAEVLFDHYYLPAKTREDARFPGRVIKTHNIYEAHGFPDPTKVVLQFHRYFRPWEDCLGLFGYAGLHRLLSSSYPTHAAGYLQLARDTTSDVLRYGSPRKVDETTGVVTFAEDPAWDFIGAAVAFLDGTRQLTAAEMHDNNYVRCGGVDQCATSGDGYMKLASGSGAFAWHLVWWALSDARGCQDLMLHRYIRNAFNGPKRWDPVDNRPNTYNHLDWLLNTKRYGAIGYQDELTVGATVARGTCGVTPSDITVSRLTADSVWLTGPATGQWRRVQRSNGAVTSTIDPPGGGPNAGWTGIVCYRNGGQAMLSALDGNDPSLNRSNYKITSTFESTPTVLHSQITFAYPGGTKRDGRAIAWDPSESAFLVLARDAAGVQSLWLIYPGSTVAVQYTGALIDLDGVESIDIDRDGRLLMMADASGNVDIYGRGPGGIWGVPRVRASISGARYVAFTDHARTDDAQRVVTTSVGTPFRETEI